MARFSEVIALVSVSTDVGADGTPRREEASTEAFFNRFSVSLENRLAGRADGLRGMVEGQVRSVDYAGQQEALLDGRRYTVSEASDSGEFTRLTLTERLSDD